MCIPVNFFAQIKKTSSCHWTEEFSKSWAYGDLSRKNLEENIGSSTSAHFFAFKLLLFIFI